MVVYHLQPDIVRLAPPIAALTPLLSAGYAAVPGFFILSGYVIWYNYHDWFAQPTPRLIVHFLYLRLARLYPVHLVTLLATLTLVITAHVTRVPVPDELFSPWDFALNLLLAQTWVPDFRFNWNYPSWSISSEWFGYLLFPFAAAGLNRLRTRRTAAAGVAAGLVGIVVFEVWGRGVPFAMLLGVVPTFLTGCMLSLLVSRLSAKPGPLLANLAAISIWVVPFVAPPGALQPTIVVLSAATVFALGWSRCSRLWTCSASVYLGEVSYSLYMSHFLVMRLVNKLCPTARFADSPPLVRAGILVGYALAIAAAALITYYAVERPARRYFRNRRPAGS